MSSPVVPSAFTSPLAASRLTVSMPGRLIVPSPPPETVAGSESATVTAVPSPVRLATSEAEGPPPCTSIVFQA